MAKLLTQLFRKHMDQYLKNHLSSSTPFSRPINKELDELVGLEFTCNSGAVRLLDYCGNESFIADAARVSYSGDNITKRSNDQSLLRYLIRHSHTSPLEMASLTFEFKVPIFTARQMFRHRTHSANEISGRYSELPNESFTIEPNEWRLQSKSNNQGSEGFLDTDLGKELTRSQEELHELVEKIYQERLALGVSNELARIDLPLSHFTRYVWKMNLHNYLHFLALREDSHAQQEIREIANLVSAIIQEGFPTIYDAWNSYHPKRDALLLTRQDQEALRHVLNDIQIDSGTLKEIFPTTREYSEYKEKISRLLHEKPDKNLYS